MEGYIGILLDKATLIGTAFMAGTAIIIVAVLYLRLLFRPLQLTSKGSTLTMITPLIIDFPTLIPKFDAILKRGLCAGLGTRKGMMCIEAAICASLDLPHGDEPTCVEDAVREYKITLNDANWSSPQARAKGLRALGIAQIGSIGVVEGKEFERRLMKATIQVLIPTLFREVFPGNKGCLEAALLCEEEGIERVIRIAHKAAGVVAYDGDAPAGFAEEAAFMLTSNYGSRPDACCVASAAALASLATPATYDKYLLLSASLALQVLKDLKSPGCEWLDYQAA